MQFDREKKVKERQIEQLHQDLADLKAQLQTEKSALKDAESRDDQLDTQREKLLSELEALDLEFKKLEQSDGFLGEQGPQDDDILIQKLEEESKFLDKLLKSADEDQARVKEETESIAEKIQGAESDVKSLESQIAGMEDFGPLLPGLQNNLSASIDQEKTLYDENLKLLEQLRKLDLDEKNIVSYQIQQEMFIHALIEQNFIERKSRLLGHSIDDLREKLALKQKVINYTKWKVEKASALVSDSNMKKVIGLSSFKQKFDRLSEDTNAISKSLKDISDQKSALDQKIFIQDIKNATIEQIQSYLKTLQTLENSLDTLVQKENDQVDLSKMFRDQSDYERDTEAEYFRKVEELGRNSDLKKVHLIKENISHPLEKEIKEKLKDILYDIEQYETQAKLHQTWNVSFLRNIEDQIKHSTKDIKLFFELEYLQQFNQNQKRLQTRDSLSSKIKALNDKLSEVDKLLDSNDSDLENIAKEAAYLKDSQFSPVKGRKSKYYGLKGDFEKEREIKVQNKELQALRDKADSMRSERDKLKQLLRQYQQKFMEISESEGPSSLLKIEDLADSFNIELDKKVEALKQTAKIFKDKDLKQAGQIVTQRVQKFRDKRRIVSEIKQAELTKKSLIARCDKSALVALGKAENIEKVLKAQITANPNDSSRLQVEAKEVSSQKTKILAYQTEISKENCQITQILDQISQIGLQVITIEALKDFLTQLKDLSRLNKYKDELKSLKSALSEKDEAAQKFQKEQTGQKMFKCEKKLKEAQALLDQILSKSESLDIRINELDENVKKGVEMFPNDEQMPVKGKKVIDDNANDKKQIQSISEQRQVILKVIDKIKQSMHDATPVSSLYDEINAEMDTCLSKANLHLKDLNRLDANLAKRLSEWETLMNQGSTKEVLNDDLNRIITDSIKNYNTLEKKAVEIEKMIASLEQVCQGMLNNNPDYQTRQSSIQKMLDSINACKANYKEVQDQMKNIEKSLNLQQQARMKGLRSLSVDKLQELLRQAEETSDNIAKQTRSSESTLKNLIKKRQKLGDADISDNLHSRTENVDTLDKKFQAIKKERDELDAILIEAQKINPQSVQQTLEQLKEMNKQLGTIQADKEQLSLKVTLLKDKLAAKDLNKDDPATFMPLINELKDLKFQIDAKDAQIASIAKQINFFKNKHGGFDVVQKVEGIRNRGMEINYKLKALKDELEVLRELQADFDGYTSDNEEESFIDRLGIELKELVTKLGKAQDTNDDLINKINMNKKELAIEGSQITSQQMEKRATFLSEVEEQAHVIDTLIEQVNFKIQRSKKIFGKMNVPDKLGRRDLEITELAKRVNQFQNQVNELSLDVAQILQETNENRAGLETLYNHLNQLQRDFDAPSATLKLISAKLNSLKSNKDEEHFEQLKQNLAIKKQILTVLQEIKKLRSKQISYKQQYNSLKPKNTYKPVNGDFVDQLLADWINNNNCPVPINRLGNGFYMFGSKKIFARILNGKLLIRVGGGYMSIDEFMFYYGAQELNRLLAYEDIQDEDDFDLDQAIKDVQENDYVSKFSDGRTVVGNQQLKRKLSPRGVSPNPAGKTSPRGVKDRVSPNRGGVKDRVSPNRAPMNGGSAGGSFLKQGLAKQTK